ncbi:MAG: VPLPA-CTERM sorting domain-containing protein [Roseobacter sp.]
MNIMKMHLIKVATLAAALTAFGTASIAATITVSKITPTVDGADIALLPTDTTTVRFENNDTTAIWFDRPDQGQSFTTGSNSAGYTMSGFSFAQRYYRWDIGTLTLNVGTITSNIFTPLVSETIAAANTPTVVGDGTSFDWYNFVLGTPLQLNANTEYAVFAGNPDTNGAVFIKSTTDTDYTGGTAYRDSITNGQFNNPVSSLGFDRVFHVDLEAVTAVPLPAGLPLLMIALGGLGLVRGRRT